MYAGNLSFWAFKCKNVSFRNANGILLDQMNCTKIQLSLISQSMILKIRFLENKTTLKARGVCQFVLFGFENQVHLSLNFSS